MKISETYELENGTVKFQGELAGEELNIVIQAGLLTLMRNGVISAAVAEQEQLEDKDIH